LAGGDALAVDPDDLVLRVHAGTEPPDDLPVHLDPARADQLLAVPPAAHAGRREDLLQPHAAGDVGEVIALALVRGEVIVVVEAHAAQRLEPGQRLWRQRYRLRRRPGGLPLVSWPATP